MSIDHAILGMLSYKPLTGYDLKKIMQESSFMPWSGNSNQIYKALLELSNKNFTTNEVCHQDSSPSKKVYTITAAGLQELKRWSQSMPESFEMKKPFLIQLAWADLLSSEELKDLISQYEQEVKGRLFIEEKKAEISFFKQGRTSRETAMWQLINESFIKSCQAELEWISKAKEILLSYGDTEQRDNTNPTLIVREEDEKMTYQIIEKNNEKYILLDAGGRSIQTEQDTMELLTICFENQIHFLLIHGDRLSEEFLDLKTGVAGTALQKFVLYNIKAAVILGENQKKGRFGELLTESNRGHVFRSFQDLGEAENWLLA